MRLNANLGAAIVSLLFLMSMVGMRAELERDWLKDEFAPRYTPMFAPPATVPAFPGAVGDGAGALDMCRDSVREGAWDLKVWKISSTDTTSGNSALEILRDSLPNYRDAYNVVLVTVDGRQDFPNGTEIDMTCTYLAGQTARGGGMTKSLGSLAITEVGSNDPHDVVIRFITNQNSNNLTIPEFGERVVVDHVTGRWGSSAGGQMNLKAGGDSTDAGEAGNFARSVTVSYPLVYEPRSGHPTNISNGSNPRDAPAASQMTFYRMASLSGGHRSPMCSADTTTFAQGIVYNWDIRASETNNQAICNFVGMFHHTGPATDATDGKNLPYMFADDCETPISGAGTDSVCVRQVYVAHQWYLSTVGNADTLLPADSRDYWAGGDSIISCRDTPAPEGYVNSKVSSEECAGATGTVVPTGWKSASFIAHDSWDFAPDTTALDSTTVEAILAEVGNSKRLNCDGTWDTGRRDGFDSARVAWLRNNWLDLGGDQGLTKAQTTAILGGADMSWNGVYVPGNPAALGGDTVTWAEMAPENGGAWCDDTDGDGMPDQYEDRMSDLDKTDATDADDDSDGDGWLSIDEYVNGTSSDVFTATDGTETPDPFTSTYANGRNVYLVPVNQDTVYAEDTLGSVTDTFIARRPDSDSIDTGTPYRAIVPTGNDSALIITCDTMTVPAAGVQDSAAVDSIAAAWGLNLGTTYPRSVTVPGC